MNLGTRYELADRALGLAAGCDCCADETVQDESWRRAACAARRLSWVSLAWMCTEGAVGLWQGLASVIVIWRFTGSRTVSQTAERRAQRGVAVSFWLLAPYIAAESARDLAVGHRAGVTVIGMVLTAVALIAMPLLGQAKRRLGARLGSAATAGEGTQNYLCARTRAGFRSGSALGPLGGTGRDTAWSVSTRSLRTPLRLLVLLLNFSPGRYYRRDGDPGFPLRATADQSRHLD